MGNGEVSTCVLGNRISEQVKGMDDRVKGLDKRLDQETESLRKVDESQWQAINQLRNRLPVWATVVISLLTCLCGVLGTLAVKG